MVSRVRNAHFYTNCQQSTSGQQSCCILVPGKASGICKEVLNLFASISARSALRLRLSAIQLVSSLVSVVAECAIGGRYLFENRFDPRVTLELFECGPELLLFLEQHGELDAQLGGLCLYLGETQGEFSLAGNGLGVATFGAVALADVLQAFCGVAAHALAVGFELLALHVLPDALHPRIGEKIGDDLRRGLLEKPVGHGLPPSIPPDCIRWGRARLTSGALHDVPDDDTPARSCTLEAGEVHAQLPGLVPGRFRRFRFSALSRASTRRWTRDIAGLVHDLGVRRCVLLSPCRLVHRFQRLAEELGAVLQRFQYLAEDSPHVVQASLQLDLGFDILDRQLHLAQLRFEADIDLDQVREHSLESYPNLQVLDLKVDLLHVERRHVQQYVGITVSFPAVLRVVDGVPFVPARTAVFFYRWTLPCLRIRTSGCHNPSSLQNISLLVCRAPPAP